MPGNKSIIKLIIVLTLFISIGCCRPGRYWCDIEQEVTWDDFIQGHKYVETRLWLRNWFGVKFDIAASKFSYDVKTEDVDKVKKEHMEEIYPAYLKLKELLRDRKYYR